MVRITILKENNYSLITIPNLRNNVFSNSTFRWDSNAMEGFPEYMKILYSALYNTTNEVADHIRREEGWDVLPYLRKAVRSPSYPSLTLARWQKDSDITTNNLKYILSKHDSNYWKVIPSHFALNISQHKTPKILFFY